MKIDRHGRAKILTVREIQLLFAQGLTHNRDRALFGTCLYCACRIREACTLRTADVYERQGRVRSELIIRKGNTKAKLATRSIPVIYVGSEASLVFTHGFLQFVRCTENPPVIGRLTI